MPIFIKTSLALYQSFVQPPHKLNNQFQCWNKFFDSSVGCSTHSILAVGLGYLNTKREVMVYQGLALLLICLLTFCYLWIVDSGGTWVITPFLLFATLEITNLWPATIYAYYTSLSRDAYPIIVAGWCFWGWKPSQNTTLPEFSDRFLMGHFFKYNLSHANSHRRNSGLWFTYGDLCKEAARYLAQHRVKSLLTISLRIILRLILW